MEEAWGNRSKKQVGNLRGWEWEKWERYSFKNREKKFNSLWNLSKRAVGGQQSDGTEHIAKDIQENLPKMEGDLKLSTERGCVLGNINTKWSTSRHIQ